MEHQTLHTKPQYSDSEREHDISIELPFLGCLIIVLLLLFIGSVGDIMEISVEIEPSQESEHAVLQSDLQVLIFRVICFDALYLMRCGTSSAGSLSPDRPFADLLHRFDHHLEMPGI